MKHTSSDMTIDELVARFVEISVAQGKANESFQAVEYNRLYKQKAAIVQELKIRNGDQRRALFHLYDHSDVQVRLNAATATFALDSLTARSALEAIVALKRFPWAGEAGMTLRLEDAGIGKLD